MANHKSAIKRIRQAEAKKEHNRYFAVTVRNAVKKLRNTTNKQEAEALYPQVVSKLDKLAKKNIIHKNKASNLKSRMIKYISTLTA